METILNLISVICNIIAFIIFCIYIRHNNKIFKNLNFKINNTRHALILLKRDLNQKIEGGSNYIKRKAVQKQIERIINLLDGEWI